MALGNIGYIQINGTLFKPQSLTVEYESLATEDSGRTDDGVNHIQWVFSGAPKLVIKMPPMKPNEASALIHLVQGQVYSLTYWDTATNSEKTISAYTGNSSAELYSGVVAGGLYRGISFNAIAMEGNY